MRASVHASVSVRNLFKSVRQLRRFRDGDFGGFGDFGGKGEMFGINFVRIRFRVVMKFYPIRERGFFAVLHPLSTLKMCPKGHDESPFWLINCILSNYNCALYDIQSNTIVKNVRAVYAIQSNTISKNVCACMPFKLTLLSKMSAPCIAFKVTLL